MTTISGTKSKWAVVGMGFIFPRHQSAIQSIGGEVLMTCDNDRSKGADFLNFKAMTENKKFRKEVTHVAILTPNYLHKGMIRSLYGKTVLCEKPLVLNSEDIQGMNGNVFTVLQLRHHPEIVRLKSLKRKPQTVSLKVWVKRDRKYWTGWKGKEEKSGGILFNLGIHYFDILMYLLGDEYKIISHSRTDTKANGMIFFGDTLCGYSLKIMADDRKQRRTLEIDGEEVMLSKEDNLSFENLHVRVYEDLLKGKGVLPNEAMKSIKLVEELNAV
jgi:UDP-N-acetyl-2-amino-2-deoxyglucuronate dehydrogenase